MSEHTNDNEPIDRARLEDDIALLNSLAWEDGAAMAMDADAIAVSKDDEPDEFGSMDDVSMTRKVYSSRKYHIPDEEDNPECRYGNKDIDYRLRDRAVAREWYDPCSCCFPDGDPAPDAEEESDA